MNTQSLRLDDSAGLVYLAKMRAIAPDDFIQQQAYAEKRGWTLQGAIAKSAMDPLDTESAAALLAPLGAPFSRSLAPSTIIGRLVGTHRAPFQQPEIRSNIVPGAGWVGDGSLPIPVVEGNFDTIIALRRTTVSSTSVLTLELARAPGSAAIERMGRGMKAGLRAAMDSSLIDRGNAGVLGVRPAAITYAAPVFASSGSSVSQVDADLQGLVDSLVDNGVELVAPAWIMAPATASHLAGMRTSGGYPAYPFITARGGTLLGIPVITSASVTAEASPGSRTVVLVDADQLEIADEGEADATTSEQAAMQMTNTPINGASAMVSLWQHNMIGIKTERTISWRMLRDEAVAVLTGVPF